MKFIRFIPVVREIVNLVLWIVDEIRTRKKKPRDPDGNGSIIVP